MSDKKPNAPQDDAWSGAGELWGALRGMIASQKWVFVGLIAAVILGEVGLRVIRPELSGLTYSARMTGGHPIAWTPEGYRIVPGEPPATAARTVLALGNSTTFGTGVGAHETWPLALNAQLGADVSVRNSADEGDAIHEFIFGLQEVWTDPAAPDVIVLLVTANMISFADFRRDGDARDPRQRLRRIERAGDGGGIKRQVVNVVQSSALWKALSLSVTSFKYTIQLQDHRVNPDRPLSPLMAYGWVQPDVPAENYTRMWTVFEDGLGDLRDVTAAQGSCLLVGFLPPRFTLSDAWRDNQKAVPLDRLDTGPEARLQQIVADLDIPFVQTATALKDARAQLGAGAPLYIPGDYTHLNAQGHEIVATRLAEVVGPLLDGTTTCDAGGVR